MTTEVWMALIGHLITTLTAIGIGYSKLTSRMTKVETKIDIMYSWFQNTVVRTGWSPRTRRTDSEEGS